MPIEHKKYDDANNALVIIGSLLCVEHDSKRPFCEVWQETLSCIAKGNYVVQVQDGQATGFATWVKLNEPLSEIFAKNLRWITPMEHDTGERVWVNKFCCSLGNGKELLTALRREIKEGWLGAVVRDDRVNLRAGDLDEYKGIIY